MIEKMISDCTYSILPATYFGVIALIIEHMNNSLKWWLVGIVGFMLMQYMVAILGSILGAVFFSGSIQISEEEYDGEG